MSDVERLLGELRAAEAEHKAAAALAASAGGELGRRGKLKKKAEEEVASYGDCLAKRAALIEGFEEHPDLREVWVPFKAAILKRPDNLALQLEVPPPS